MKFFIRHSASILLLLFSLVVVSACSPATLTPATAKPDLEITSTITPPLDLTPEKDEIPGYIKTTLEINRNGRAYSVVLGYSIGDAYLHITPAPDYDLDSLYGKNLNRRSAFLYWMGDVDQDGEKEYLLEAYSPGARGLMILLAVDYDAKLDEYRIFDEMGFDIASSGDWDDIEKDGIPEYLAKNASYPYSFDGPMLVAFSPLYILRYDGKQFVEVTESYPDLLVEVVDHWQEAIENDAWGQGQFASIYAAYLRDMFLLGEQEEGLQYYTEQCNARLYPNSNDPLRNCDALLDRIKKAINEKW